MLLGCAVGLVPLLSLAQPIHGVPGRTVVCQARANSAIECRTGFRGPAELVRNLSRVRCVEGRNWGNRAGGRIWIRDGCAGEFAQARGPGWAGGAQAELLRCESTNGSYRECRLAGRGTARLVRQLSSAACVQGRSWGQRGRQLWVDRGCRAEFHVVRQGGSFPGGGNYAVTCSSVNEQAAFCAWDFRMGYPRVLEQLSNAPCREGLSWGVRGRGEIWVSQGCRARFGVR